LIDMKNKHGNNGSALPAETGLCCCLASRLICAVVREFAGEFRAHSPKKDIGLPRQSQQKRRLDPAAAVPVPALTRSTGSLPKARRVRPGSVRDRLYQVLRASGPLRRIEIVQAVAASLRVPAGEQLEKRVEAILLDRADRQLRRIRRGVYEYVPSADHDPRARLQA
jgi:hypothetical protein